MTAIGKIESFDETQEKWETYVERVEQFFLANNIDEDHQAPTLLSLMGSKTYTLLRDLLTPDKPATKSFQEIVTTLQQHLSPKPLEIAERFRFYKRIQREGETVLTYVADLKKLATHCNFGANLNEALRDKLVCGLRNVQIQKRLLSEAKLKYSKALEIAIAMETAIRDAAELQSELQSEPRVDKISDNHTQAPSPNPTTKVCYRCGGDSHATHNCRFKDQTCYHCGKVGHISRACRSKQQGKPKQPPKPPLNTQVHSIEYSESDEFEDVLGSIQIHNVSKPSSTVIWIDLKVEGKPLKMELDTGSAVSIIPHNLYREKFHDKPLQETKLMLKTYTGENIFPAGVLKVNVEYKDQQPLLLDLYVVKNKGPVLMGRDWLHKVRLDWYAIKSLKASQTLSTTKEQLQTMLDKYSDVFEDKLGTFKSAKAKLTLKEDSQAHFCKARAVPYALRPKVEEELRRLQNEGILTKVEWSEWATPIVPVPKKDGSVRLCGDYKGTVNPELQAEQYPLPRIEDIFAKLAGGQKFSKIDLRQAYHQLEMEEDSRKYLTINTHMGLFQYNRLVFGITSAPAIWQRTIDQVLEGTSGTSCILDDMIITGKSDEEHLANLEEVLRRLQFHGLRANKAKCEFFKEKITYCGHDIDKDGLHKSTAKVEAVLEAPRPNDVAEVRSFLGLINYYHRFLPNLSTTVHPLTQLLGKDHQWKWTEQCEAAFHKVKEMITSEQVLTHYDPSLPLRLACDASPVGIGAVLSHVINDGTERPIAFASRTLTKTEQKYAQIDKEALSIIWGVKKFHMYLFGRPFTLYTDHQPLTSIFHPRKSIPVVTAARLQRYALFLAGYDYSIQYKNTKVHSNADGLSRLPLLTEAKDEEVVDPVGVFNLMQFDPLPVTVDNVRRETQRDPVLAQVHEMTRKGWPNNHDPVLNPYFVHKDEITLQSGCLMWGIRVIIPPKLRPQVLKELHQGHMGVVKMKALARSYTWWPGIDKEIELSAKSCPGCQLVQREPSTVPVHPWEWPSLPWQRIHIDFAGPFLNSMFLVVVDAHSRWLEIEKMNTTTSAKTIETLQKLFARYGVPAQLVSDNGPQFTSEEFQQFLKRNGIKHITSAPYHPATNGLAERAVQSFKNAMKSETEVTSLNIKLARFLLTYRITPHSTTGEPPSQLFLGRRLRTRLDLLKPDLFIQVNNRQIDQSVAKSGSVTRHFAIGQRVIARNYTGKSKWVPGIVRARLGPLSYEVEIGPNLVWRRHTDQLRDSNVPVTDRHPPVSYPLPFPLPATTTDHPVAELPEQTEVVSRETDCPSPKCNPVAESSASSSPTQIEHVPVKRYPSRVRQPQVRMDL